MTNELDVQEKVNKFARTMKFECAITDKPLLLAYNT